MANIGAVVIRLLRRIAEVKGSATVMPEDLMGIKPRKEERTSKAEALDKTSEAMARKQRERR